MTERFPFKIYDEDLQNFNDWLKDHDVEILRENREKILDEVKEKLQDAFTSTEYDYNNFEYIPEHSFREVMDSLYIPNRLNTLCRYEYSCGSFGGNSCEKCKDNKNKIMKGV